LRLRRSTGIPAPSEREDRSLAAWYRPFNKQPSHREGYVPVAIGRRELIAALAGVAAWPLAGHAQQAATPVVGFLSGLSAGERPHLVESFRRGLSEAGYAAGQNVAIEYRYAENQPDRLRALAADLIGRRAAVIAATGGNNPALVAKSLTTTIPIVFTSGADPVRAGLVSNFSRPEGNVTGVSWFSVELGAKHLELVLELVPAAGIGKRRFTSSRCDRQPPACPGCS
jgi:putative ABC transport system substrate-binding protein